MVFIDITTQPLFKTSCPSVPGTCGISFRSSCHCLAWQPNYFYSVWLGLAAKVKLIQLFWILYFQKCLKITTTKPKERSHDRPEILWVLFIYFKLHLQFVHLQDKYFRVWWSLLFLTSLSSFQTFLRTLVATTSLKEWKRSYVKTRKQELTDETLVILKLLVLQVRLAW